MTTTQNRTKRWMNHNGNEQQPTTIEHQRTNLRIIIKVCLAYMQWEEKIFAMKEIVINQLRHLWLAGAGALPYLCAVAFGTMSPVWDGGRPSIWFDIYIYCNIIRIFWSCDFCVMRFYWHFLLLLLLLSWDFAGAFTSFSYKMFCRKENRIFFSHRYLTIANYEFIELFICSYQRIPFRFNNKRTKFYW